MNTLFTNANILQPDGSIVAGCLGVEDSRIAFVGQTPDDFLAQRLINCEGNLLMPSLVDAHTHLPMSLLRNSADDMDLHTWLRDRIWPMEAQLTPEDIYWGALLGIAELIRGGCVTVNDMYMSPAMICQAAAESGIRGLFGIGILTGSDNGAAALAETEALYRDWNGAEDGRIRVAVMPHAEYTCTESTLKKCGELAHRLDAPLHIHISETYQEHEECKDRHHFTPTAFLASLGMLGKKTLLAHCVHCDVEDLQLISSTRATVLHCPQSNLKLGSGIAPVQTMLAYGINVALGTDGAASNNNLDMFEELRLAATLHKGVTMNPLAVTAKEALAMGTLNGARALGFESGALIPGALADLILVNVHTPSMQPVYRLASAAVYGASASDVLLTMGNGRVLYENGEYYTLDIDRIFSEAQRISDKFRA